MQSSGAAASADDATSWVAERLVAVMADHGIPHRQQAAWLGELCGLSASQARRKLRGAVWSIDEVLAVVRRLSLSLDEMFASPGGDGVVMGQREGAPFQDAFFLVDGARLACQVRLGPLAVGAIKDADLLTVQDGMQWLVGTAATLGNAWEKRFRADQVLLSSALSAAPVRVAVLDDEDSAAETLAEWFQAADYEARAFTSFEALYAEGLGKFDAFIVDFLLAGGESSQAAIKQIRASRPDAPVLLLTGKLRDGQASEAELAAMLRTENVTFFEKPVRPSVLAASIEKELDKLAERAEAAT